MGAQLRNDGRYTAYHVYQGLDFSEANRASTIPYKTEALKCAHSQRGYLFQFDSMPERNHFDAANTSCCDEPVMNFANKPQYSAASKPMKARDCRNNIRVQGCEALEVSSDEMSSICASDSPKPASIRIRCPRLCPEFSGLPAGETLSGRHGVFRSVGMEAGDVMILEYTPHQDIMDNIHGACSGTSTLTESFCGGYSIEFTVSAGLDFPGGCGCDCCGEKGVFPPPNISITAPDSIPANWGNSVNPASTIIASSACKGADITARFIGVNGDGQVSWSSPTEYVSDGLTRYVTRAPVSAGAASNPACCGGFIEWKSPDGCGSLAIKTSRVIPQLSAVSIAPASGSRLTNGVIYDFSVSGVCSFSDSAALSLSSVCLDNTPGPLNRSNGLLKRSFTQALSLNPTPQCSACCGAGSITLSFSNGCGSTGTATYTVGRPLSFSASTLVAGKQFRCARYYVMEPSPGYVYDIETASIYCDGHAGPYTRAYWGAYPTADACASMINSPQADYINSQTARQGLSDPTACLFFTGNGQSGMNLVSGLFSILDKCCHPAWQDVTWINRIDPQKCCPN